MAIALYLILSVAIFIGNNLSINALKYFPLTKFQNGSCPTWKKIREIVEPDIQNTLNSNEKEWRSVISLNMRDPLQNCPSGWSLYNTTTRSRSCGQTSAPGCSVATWTVNHSYSKVRGRALGFAKGDNDAFMGWTSHRDAALNYADGMNVFLATASPQHVWTFAVDHLHYGPPRDVHAPRAALYCSHTLLVPTTSVIVIVLQILKFGMELDVPLRRAATSTTHLGSMCLSTQLTLRTLKCAFALTRIPLTKELV